MFGVPIKSFARHKIDCSVIADDDVCLQLSDIRAHASENIHRAAQENATRFNAGKAQVKWFVICDFVFAKCNEGMLTKLDRKYRGSF